MDFLFCAISISGNKWRNLLPGILSCAPSGPTSGWVGVTLKAGR